MCCFVYVLLDSGAFCVCFDGVVFVGLGGYVGIVFCFGYIVGVVCSVIYVWCVLCFDGWYVCFGCVGIGFGR